MAVIHNDTALQVDYIILLSLPSPVVGLSLNVLGYGLSKHGDEAEARMAKVNHTPLLWTGEGRIETKLDSGIGLD